MHQLLALLSFPFGYEGAFAILLLSTLVVFPVAAWRFAQVFVPPAAASYAAIVAAFAPGVALAAHSFGQLPTLLSVTVTLFLVFESTRFVERGGGLRLGLVGALAGTSFAAHHATPMFFLPPALLAGLSTVVIAVDRGALFLRLRRGGIQDRCRSWSTACGGQSSRSTNFKRGLLDGSVPDRWRATSSRRARLSRLCPLCARTWPAS